MKFSWPSTPRSLLTQIADLAEGEDEAHWTRFVELYSPAIARFVQMQDAEMPQADVEDIVQETLEKLVPVLRGGSFDPKKAKFSTFLSAVLRRAMIDRLRRLTARRAHKTTSITNDMEIAGSVPDPAVNVEIAWRLARHHAAVQHVFAHSALSAQSRRVYVMSAIDGLSAKEIGEKLGLAENAVRSIRSRVAKMIAAVESQYDN